MTRECDLVVRTRKKVKIDREMNDARHSKFIRPRLPLAISRARLAAGPSRILPGRAGDGGENPFMGRRATLAPKLPPPRNPRLSFLSTESSISIFLPDRQIMNAELSCDRVDEDDGAAAAAAAAGGVGVAPGRSWFRRYDGGQH
jgi:hypothetical protein